MLYTPNKHYKSHTPTLVKAFNYLIDQSKYLQNQLPSLQKEYVLNKASRTTGLKNYGSTNYIDTIDTMLKQVSTEGNLSHFGQMAFVNALIENLQNRLKIIYFLEKHPEILNRPLIQPIFITGWYRTGTTYLHNLLSTLPGMRVPYLWELRHPCPNIQNPENTNTNAFIRKTKRMRRIHRYLAPDFDAAHSMDAEKPEECLHLFENTAMSTMAFFITECKSFAQSLLNHNMEEAYFFYRAQLQLLDWQRPGQRWLLKWPYHLWHLKTLLQTFPDAHIVQIHRSPIESIPSTCSLASLARAPFCQSIDCFALGDFWTNYYKTGLERSFNARTSTNKNQFTDIVYKELIENPSAVIKKITNRTNIEYEIDNKIKTKNRTQKNKNRSSHHYDAKHYNIDPDILNEKFSSYINEFELT